MAYPLPDPPRLRHDHRHGSRCGDDRSIAEAQHDVSSDAVRAGLAGVSASAHFEASERDRALLSVVVEKAPAGRTERIKALTIAAEVLARETTFGPQRASILRMKAGRTRRSLERGGLTDGCASHLCIGTPRGRYAPVFALSEPAPLPSVLVGPPRAVVVSFEEEGDRSACPSFTRRFARSPIIALPRFIGLHVIDVETALHDSCGIPLKAARPERAEAFACLSLIRLNAFRFRHPILGADVDPLDRAPKLAARAVELAPDSSRTHYAVGIARRFAGDADGGSDEPEVGHALNPNDATIIGDIGRSRAMRARRDKAVPPLEESRSIDPAQPGICRVGRCIRRHARGRFEAALAEARRINAPCVVRRHVGVVAAAAPPGRGDEAADAVATIRALEKDCGRRAAAGLVSRHPARAPSAAIIADLAKAGLRAPARARGGAS